MSECPSCPDLSEFVPKTSLESVLTANGKLVDKIILLATTGTATQVDARSQACSLIPANTGQVTIAIPDGFIAADMFGAPLIQRLSGNEELGVGNYSVDGAEITYDLVGQASVAGSHKICQSFSKLS